MSYFRPNIERMEGYVPGYQPKEPGFVKLNTNENPYPPSPRVLEAIAAAGDGLRLYPDPMAQPFREQAARVLGTVPERILCANGSDELLTMALRCFCGEGDAVAYPAPTYSLYPKLADIQGARAVEIAFPDDFSLPDGLPEAGAPLTLLCNPNAPSGTLVPVAQVERLAESVSGVLLVDEAYVAFADEDCLALVDRHENVIVARTLSKSHSLAGLRFGFAVAQEPLIEGLAKVKDSYNVDRLALAGATAAIADEEWTATNVRKIKATRARLTEGLRGLGFFCCRDAGEVFRRLFERKILVRYWDAPRLSDCLRVSVGTDEQTATLLNALKEIVT
jgi:histidinol-phosphate aminotransferase